LAKFTNASTVPIKTGYLVQNWGFDIGNLQARWYPKAAYAPYVEGELHRISSMLSMQECLRTRRQGRPHQRDARFSSV
jgi:hypothetical protein